MARPRQYDELTVRDALRDVFWERGYEGASYAHIMSATGLKKGSLYASFGDKKSLYEIALKHYAETQGRDNLLVLEDDRLTVGVKLNAFFGAVLSSIDTPKASWGCFVCNAAGDPAIEGDENKTLVKDIVRDMRDVIAEALPDNKKQKADHILSAYMGSRALVKVGADQDQINRICRSLLDDI